MLIRIIGNNFVAGAILTKYKKEKRCFYCAPYIKKLIYGKNLYEIIDICMRKGWTIQLLGK